MGIKFMTLVTNIEEIVRFRAVYSYKNVKALYYNQERENGSDANP